MNTDEVAAELSQPGAQQLLRHGPLARLGYTGRDGHPVVIPIGFHWDGARVYLCTAPTAPKVSALAAHPEVALTIDSEGAAQSLLLRGRSETEVVDGVPPEYLAASRKTMAAHEQQAFEAQVRATYKQMARIAVTPGWARFYDFEAGRLPGFLRKLVDGG